MSIRHALPIALIVVSLCNWTVIRNGSSRAYAEEKPMATKAFELLGVKSTDAPETPNCLLPPRAKWLARTLKDEKNLGALKKDYEEQNKKLDLDNTIIGLDGTLKQTEIRRLANLIHARMPGVLVAVKGTLPPAGLRSCVDIHIPADPKLSSQAKKDWDALQKLQDCVEAVCRRKHQRRYKVVLAKAEKALAFRMELIGELDKQPKESAQLAKKREKLAEVITEFLPLAKPFEKWDKDAMSLARSAEVRVAKQTARRRKALFERHQRACRALEMKALTREEWCALWPKRVLFSQGFEGPPTKAFDWSGVIETKNVPKGSKRALAGKTGDKYFARRTRTGIYYDNARASTTTWVRFKYFINKPLPIGVFVFNMTQADNWVYTIKKPVVGKWTEITLNVTESFRKKGGGKARVKAADGLDDVFVHAGKPGDDDLQLIVDDVELIGLD